MIKVADVKRLIEETLAKVPPLNSEKAVTQMLYTAAVESSMGYSIYQNSGGPGVGLMQVEPFTAADNYYNFLRFNPILNKLISDACGVEPPDTAPLSYNMAYNILMARIKYYRSSTPIPETIRGMAEWHESWYNTKRNGADDVSAGIKKYLRIISS